MRDYKALILFECSGAIRGRISQRDGWTAISMDAKHAEDAGDGHLVCWINRETLDRVTRNWKPDLVVMHPPCTYLASSGLHWNHRIKGRDAKTDDALAMVSFLMTWCMRRGIPYALENPVGAIGSRIRKASQYIHPWQFGHPESKRTGLWLDGLPLLKPTEILDLPECGYWDNQTPSRQNKLGPSCDRATIRSRTYAGIADAMVDQWCSFIEAK